ncbi:MAG: peptidoglycan DD-metalloendopeptidase family protein [Bacteroidetes bacterium]|jgi:murein DD-endopeptidase MepM/ murein hydrolase activator NlpD|nr:peptidoglycan DD-metalloendopeptidase family protein [Bacteroidota bacterium]MBT5530110.1 peptidoglycan DD-metalloendopeptidase family protein [Cytophagia bacterium]MBT3934875.1 peptidoglycan DD-metalloendopeptidase family protein [Bacteroidota bacterium]MBT4340035.1 peptidoglycan DD-metalloendopeptidase family protein [Bacteroidota bacterium]MBT4726963.1 peptidoglycan DD-metalloendopeptidase family protein [Bacteroidota bacterium]
MNINKPKVFIPIIIAAIVLVVLIILLIPNKQSQEIITVEESDSVIVVKPNMAYGFNIDSFDFLHGTIEPNQIFSSMLSPYGISQAFISELADSAKNIMPLRKIQSGKNYIILLSKDSLESAQYFIYEKNAIDYVVFKLSHPIKIYEDQRAVDTLISTASGVITSSLWADMAKNGYSPLLIQAMSEIYEWDINFFAINKGDKYKLVYEQTQVEGEFVGIGKIISAWFEYAQEDYYAFYFIQGERDDYYDDQGKNLRKMLLRAPLKYSRISSGFSNSRMHPILKRYRPHHGVDYSAASGTPIVSVGDGVVIFAAYSGGAGNMVKIQHNGTYTTGYLHLSRYGKGIRKGAKVKQGDVIGYVGSTGLSTGPHLDYRIWKNGSAINPLTLKLPPVESVADSNLIEFNIVKDSLKKELDKIPTPTYSTE